MATPSPPVVTSVVCATAAPSAALNVAWTTTGGYTGPFTIAVQDADGTVAGTTVGGSSGGTWSGATLDVTKAWFVVVITSDPNVTSAVVPILVTQPTGLGTAYDGNSVTITWTNPAGPVPPQIQLALRTQNNWEYFPPIANYRSGKVYANTAIVDPTQPWWGVAAAVLGIATGPWSSPAAVLKNAPSIAAISTALINNALTAQITTPTSAALNYSQNQAFHVRLYAGGDIFFDWPSVASQTAAPGATTLQIAVALTDAGWPFPPGYDYTFAIGQVNPSSSGPLGRRQSYPIAPPSIANVTYATGNPNDTVTISLTPPPGTPGATGAQLQVVDTTNASKASASIAGFTGSLLVPTGTVAGCSVMAATSIGVASGPFGATKIPLITTAPTLSSIGFDGKRLRAQCNALTGVTGVTGYAFAVQESGQTIATAIVGGTSAVIDVRGNNMTVSVAAVGASTIGPSSAATSLLTAAPGITQLAFNADGTATVTFGGVGASNVLNYQLLNGSTLVTSGSLTAGVSTLALTSAQLTPGQSLAIRGQLSVTSPVSSTGPWSDAAPISTSAPANLRVQFDGRSAWITWPGSQAARVTGYTVNIVSTATSAAVLTASCSGTSIHIDCSSLAVADGYAVTVTPVVGSLPGPSASPVPLFATGLYLSAPLSGGNPVTPYIAAATDFTRSAFIIPLYLPEIFNPPLTTIPTPPANFGFAAAPAGAAPFRYLLTIPTSNPCWTFGADAIRASVATAVAGLRTWLEANNVTGYGMQLVNDLIGRAMPQTFGETLLYGGGFDLVGGTVDLRAGHVLRVEYEAYQYQGTSNPYARYLNGFVGANVSTYDVVSSLDASGRWTLALDAFLAQMTSYMSVPTPDSSGAQAQGGGGVADLFYSAFRQPYCRVVYPSQFFGQGEVGSPSVSYNIALVAAGTLSALSTATTNLRSHTVNLGTAAAVYFRGRPVVTVGGRIWVNGIERFAPLGTTVGNVLESLARRPGYAALPLSGLTLQRAPGAIATGQSVATSGVSIGNSYRVAFDWNPVASGSISASWLDLPVLPGDRLWLDAP